MNHTPPSSPLPRRFVIYLPTARPREKQVCEAVDLMLCHRLGGVTSYPARCIFTMADGKRRTENIQVLEAYCEADGWARRRPYLRAMARVVAAVLDQEAIACAVDGRMELIPPDSKGFSVTLGGGPNCEYEAVLTALIAEALQSDLK